MSQDKALVLVTTSFPISGDGSEAAGGFVADLADALAARIPVRVVAPGACAGRKDWSPGVVVHRYAAPGRPLSTLKPWRPADLGAIRSLMASGLDATRAAVDETPTQHILALWALPSGHWARAVSRQRGVPYSVWTLGSDIWSLGRIPLIRGYLRRVLCEATHCYSDGLKLADDTRAIAGRSVEFLPSTRRIESVRPHPRRNAPPYRLVFLGRWHPNKGVDLLLDALGQLDEADWARIESVTICGGGPLANLVGEGVSRLRKAGYPVEQRGFLDKPEAEAAIAGADFLLIPSRIESIPVVFSDAMKLGCPVIACPVGDLPTIIADGKTGFLAADVTARAFAAALSQSLGSGQMIEQEAIRKTSDQFDLAVMADTLCRNVGPA